MIQHQEIEYELLATLRYQASLDGCGTTKKSHELRKRDTGPMRQQKSARSIDVSLHISFRFDLALSKSRDAIVVQDQRSVVVQERKELGRGGFK